MEAFVAKLIQKLPSEEQEEIKMLQKEVEKIYQEEEEESKLSTMLPVKLERQETKSNVLPLNIFKPLIRKNIS
jgi:hypothetical protein